MMAALLYGDVGLHTERRLDIQPAVFTRISGHILAIYCFQETKHGKAAEGFTNKPLELYMIQTRNL